MLRDVKVAFLKYQLAIDLAPIRQTMLAKFLVYARPRYLCRAGDQGCRTDDKRSHLWQVLLLVSAPAVQPPRVAGLLDENG